MTPKMTPKWYTSVGDDGYTGVLGRERVPKYADRPVAYGTVDELQSSLGVVRAQAQEPRICALVLKIQRDLYHLMADLATLPEAAKRPPWLPADKLRWLEQTVDELGAEVEMPSAFIIPGDSVAGAYLDLTRAIARRAERHVARLAHNAELRDDTPLKYLNRLSSLLFVMARIEDRAAGVTSFTLAAED
jgi:cob(I)alamin adenosyltransferase